MFPDGITIASTSDFLRDLKSFINLDNKDSHLFIYLSILCTHGRGQGYENGGPRQKFLVMLSFSLKICYHPLPNYILIDFKEVPNTIFA